MRRHTISLRPRITRTAYYAVADWLTRLMRMDRSSVLTALAFVLMAATLAACGGGGSAPPPAQPPEPEPEPQGPARGSVVEVIQESRATVGGLVVPVDIPRAAIDVLTRRAGVSALTGSARCNVDIKSVVYHSIDPLGAPTVSSAAILTPQGDGPCTGARPVVLYGRGTDTEKSKNMADFEKEAESALMMAFFASQGFIVVLPNYQGYDRSTLDFHPFLNAEAQAVDMVDALRAAKSALAGLVTSASATLFLTGYSQGGHVAMATQRTLERDHAGEFTVTASAPMSGPYNMVGFGDANVAGRVNDGATALWNLLLTAYQRSYGNIYAQPSDVYSAPFAATAESLFPGAVSRGDLAREGKLPLDDRNLFGADGLLRASFRDGFARTPFRAALQLNTLLDWTPVAPMAMCGGAEDPVVFFDINAPVAQASFAARGVAVDAYDLEDRASLPAGADVDALFDHFRAQKASGSSNYHAGLLAPHCMALARRFFTPP